MPKKYIQLSSLETNYIEQNAIMDDISSHFDTFDFDKPLPVELEKIERQAIVEKFNMFDGNRTKTANALGIGRTNLIKKLKKYGLF